VEVWFILKYTTPETNQFGLFNLSIGSGIQPNGLFANISWATGSRWMQLELSQNDGATFTLIGASEMLSVPYALYAGTSNTPDPQGQSDSTFFNPLYPDGTMNMVGVSQLITDSTFYVVPAGKNLHVVKFQVVSTAQYNLAEVEVNGIEYIGNYGAAQSFFVFGAGDSITCPQSSPSLILSGYLMDSMVIPVNVDLGNGTYIVPNGKQFFVTYCSIPKDISTPKIQINGISLIYFVAPTLPIILSSGETISVTPATFDTFLYGYLK